MISWQIFPEGKKRETHANALQDLAGSDWDFLPPVEEEKKKFSVKEYVSLFWKSSMYALLWLYSRCNLFDQSCPLLFFWSHLIIQSCVFDSDRFILFLQKSRTSNSANINIIIITKALNPRLKFDGVWQENGVMAVKSTTAYFF